MTKSHPSVTVVVLNFNKKEDLLQCLGSVTTLDYAPYRILVVDNGSCDGSAAAVAEAFPQAHLLCTETNLGAPLGRNRGAAYACEHLPADYLLFLDNDTLVHRALLHHLSKALTADPKAAVAFGKGYMAYPSKTFMSAGLIVDLTTGRIYDRGAGEADHGQYDEPMEMAAGGGFGFLVRAAVYERLNGMDGKFSPYGWEEVDLCLRARRAGYRSIYVPEAVLYHKGGKIGRGPVAAYEQHKAKNLITLLWRHTRPWQKPICFTFVLLREVLALAKLMLQGRFDIVGSHFKGLSDFVLRRRA